MHLLGKAMTMLAALALLTSMAPPSTAVTASPTTDEMAAEVAALMKQFETNNPEFVAKARASWGGVPAPAAAPLLDLVEARGHARGIVIYDTPTSEYAEFLVMLYRFYRDNGGLGVEALKALPGEEIAALVDDGVLPSHDTYQKFNLLAFYASLLDPENERWLLERPKTTARADIRVREVVDGITPEMREDAGGRLGEAMAEAYTRILMESPDTSGLLVDKSHEVPMPPTPPIEGVPSAEETRAYVQELERSGVQGAQYELADVMPLAEDVKLTAMSELTTIVSELTSLTDIYTTLETYYYEYQYYYHYEKLERTWWYMLYIVDHVEQHDIVRSEIYTENVYKLVEYLYNYQDIITVEGLVTGVLGAEYRKMLPSQAQDTPVPAILNELNHPPQEVQILLDFVVPFTFDITDELDLYYLQEIVNNIINTLHEEFHYYWEYHIRNYWYWDPLGEEMLPFANADLATSNEYVVSVAEELDVGKVLEVIPVRSMYREASISVFSPADEYPLLDKGVHLHPTPVGFVPSQMATGETARTLEENAHVGPAPNAADVRASAMRLTDHLIATANGERDAALGTYAAVSAALSDAYSDPTSLYSLIPEELRVTLPSTDVEPPAAPQGVDTGADAYQVLAWETTSLPSFVPQFAYAGIRVADTAGEGRPILVNVNARGLGAPVTFALDLNEAAAAKVHAAATGAAEGELPEAPSVSGTLPSSLGPTVEWAEAIGAWGRATVQWARGFLE